MIPHGLAWPHARNVKVAYAVRMALWQYGMGASLTAPCDAEVARLCQPEDAKEINKVVIGTYGQCLVSQPRKAITSPACRALVNLASKEGAYVGYNYSAAELTATFKKLEEVSFVALILQTSINILSSRTYLHTGKPRWIFVAVAEQQERWGRLAALLHDDVGHDGRCYAWFCAVSKVRWPSTRLHSGCQGRGCVTQ